MRKKVLCIVTLAAVIAISACTVKPNTTDIDLMPISVTENTGDSDMDGNTDIQDGQDNDGTDENEGNSENSKAEESKWYVAKETVKNEDGTTIAMAEYNEFGIIKNEKYNEKNGQISYSQMMEYNEKGMEAKCTEYEYGSLVYNGEFVYDSVGNQIYTIYESYDSDGALSQKKEMKVDSQNSNKLIVTEYRADGSIISTEEILLNDDGNIKSSHYEYDFLLTADTEYYENGGAKTKTQTLYGGKTSVYEYDENGQEIKMTTKNANGAVEEYYEIEYVTEGKESIEYKTRYDSNGNPAMFAETRYDENGNRVYYTYYNAGEEDRAYWQKTEYDKAGEVVHQTTHMTDGTETEEIASTYGVNGSRTTYYSDGSGNIYYTEEILYDDNGNICEATKYSNNQEQKEIYYYEYTLI